MKRYLPSVDLILSAVSICHDTGIVKWVHSGKIAGAKYTTKQGKSYRQIKLFGVVYPLHRVVAKACGILTDESMQVDHVNGNGLDNRICNLRQVTPSQNSQNSRMQKTNTSGVPDVCFNKTVGKWQARISVNGKRISLGYYSSIDCAAKARKLAEIKYNYHPNHGSERPL